MTLNILCLDDDDGVRLSTKILLKTMPHYHAQFAPDWESAKLILDTDAIDILLLDVNLGDVDRSGVQLLPEIKKNYPDIDVIIVTGERDSSLIIRAIRAGAADYYQKPVQKDLIVCIQKIEWKRDNDSHRTALVQELAALQSSKDFIGTSPVFLKVIETATRLKNQDASVLIEAETGTGKELLAKYIHDIEEDSRRPFIVINCATLPENLVESELFGHEKGAFTGAIDKKMGRFQLANGGDVFLDEINSLNLNLQAKLLRVLQEKIIYPVGSKRPIEANFRIIAATNENLKRLVEKGLFREDLYHRLNVVKLTIPLLKERREDIPLLINHFIRKHSPKKTKTVSKVAMRHLMAYDWPGNVRELENIIHSLVVLTKDEVIDVNDLPDCVTDHRVHPAIINAMKAFDLQFDDDADFKKLKLREFQKMMQVHFLKLTIKSHQGNIQQAAKSLGVSRQSIYKLLSQAKDNYGSKQKNH